MVREAVMSLPLLTRVADDDVAFALTRRNGTLPLVSARTVAVARRGPHV